VLQGLENGFQDRAGPQKYIAVPEPQYAKATCSKKSVAALVVVGLLNMLAAVELNDHACFQAGKVTNVGTDRMLSAKFEPGLLPRAQVLPKQIFRICWRFSKVSCAAEHAATVSLSSDKRKILYNL
jgi:hypothetical protein